MMRHGSYERPAAGITSRQSLLRRPLRSSGKGRSNEAAQLAQTGTMGGTLDRVEDLRNKEKVHGIKRIPQRQSVFAESMAPVEPDRPTCKPDAPPFAQDHPSARKVPAAVRTRRMFATQGPSHESTYLESKAKKKTYPAATKETSEIQRPEKRQVAGQSIRNRGTEGLLKFSPRISTREKTVVRKAANILAWSPRAQTTVASAPAAPSAAAKKPRAAPFDTSCTKSPWSPMSARKQHRPHVARQSQTGALQTGSFVPKSARKKPQSRARIEENHSSFRTGSFVPKTARTKYARRIHVDPGAGVKDALGFGN